ncbi:MAG: hypothetical protein QOJ29_3925 [Thermoleophilaceae bacterium]|nr:hypothetical protein [Thermoleophilaceae bacterium]
MTDVRLLLYAEVDMNLVDGSSVWVQSTGLMLASLPGVTVDLLLRVPRRRDVLLGPLDDHPSVAVIEPELATAKRLLEPEAAVDAIADRDRQVPYDVVMLRGRAVAEVAASRGLVPGRLWAYVVPMPGNDAAREAEWLEPVAAGFDRVLCQTQEVRGLLRRAVPRASGKLMLMPPAIPDVRPPRGGEFSGRLLYAGKIAPEYMFLETVAAFRRFREAVPEAELHVAGDKIHDPPDVPAFKREAEAVLRSTPGLVWHGAVARAEVEQLATAADVGLSIRSAALARSLELSTKVIEYGAAGCPPVISATPIYRDLLGADYPAFANSEEALLAVLQRFATEPAMLELARSRSHAASSRFTFDRLAPPLHRELNRLGRGATSADALVAAGHQLAFIRPVLHRLREDGVEIREDVWQKHDAHDPETSASLLAGTAVAVAEWCLGNAVFYAGAKGPAQRLVVHFHRSELETRFPPLVEVAAVDRFVFVAEHVRLAAIERFGWDEASTLVIPNPVDTAVMDRPKLAGAPLTIGMVGYVPALKRLDRALDVLELVRSEEPRFRLLVKGRPPASYAWMEGREAEWSYYDEQYRRIAGSPLLRDAVIFEAYGTNLAEFFRKCGYVISPSDVEGHAVALGEAMASRSVPIVFARPGALDQYPPEAVHATAASAAEMVLSQHRAAATWHGGERAREWALEWDIQAVAEAWWDLLADVGLVVSDRSAQTALSSPPG